MAREQTSYDAKPKTREAFDLESLVAGGPDITVTGVDKDLAKLMADEKFMNEIVHVRFIRNGDPNAPKMIEIGVNVAGITGPMGPPTQEYPDGKPGVAGRGKKSMRKGYQYGEVYPMPRYMLEAVAHAKVTTLKQVTDARDPMRTMHIEEHSFAYPVEVVRDDNPKGRAWFDKVCQDPA